MIPNAYLSLLGLKYYFYPHKITQSRPIYDEEKSQWGGSVKYQRYGRVAEI